jgi:hypothetical protein
VPSFSNKVTDSWPEQKILPSSIRVKYCILFAALANCKVHTCINTSGSIHFNCQRCPKCAHLFNRLLHIVSRNSVTLMSYIILYLYDAVFGPTGDGNCYTSKHENTRAKERERERDVTTTLHMLRVKT